MTTAEESEDTKGRREFTAWLGKAAVLTLAAAAAASCRGRSIVFSGSGEDGGAGKGADAFDFAPATDRAVVFKDWPERTVDEQDLEAILRTWRLQVDGMVERPAVLTFDDLVKLKRTDQVTDLHCVEGWSVLDIPWNGVSLRTLAEKAGPLDTATHVTFHTIKGLYNESLPLDVALEPRSILAYGVDGATLPLKHGFPLRLVVPRLLGYKNAKYVERVEFTDHAEAAYWTVRGYDYLGEVPKKRLRQGRW